MSDKNIQINNKEKLNEMNNIYIWKRIRSKYVLQQIFKYLNQRIFLKIIKYNRDIQKNLEKGHKDYKKYCEIEIEIIPTENEYYRNGPFINFNTEESYYHVYYNDRKEETKRKNKNYLTKNIKKIKVIIDYQVKSFCELFRYCCSIKSINFIKFNRNDIRKMSYMFDECSALQEVNFSNFNTMNLIDISFLFYGSKSLRKINLSNFNTNNVRDMRSMFKRCESLKELNLSNFNTINVRDMNSMFLGCSSLEELNLSNFNTNNVINMSFMFYGCKSLKNLNLINFKINHNTDMTLMLYNCLSIEELHISNSFFNEVKNQEFTSLPHELKLKIKA